MKHKSDHFSSALCDCRMTTSKSGLPWEKRISIHFIHVSKTHDSFWLFFPVSTYFVFKYFKFPCHFYWTCWISIEVICPCMDWLYHMSWSWYLQILVYHCFLFPYLLKDIVLCCLFHTIVYILHVRILH